jgi:hypothetical protein
VLHEAIQGTDFGLIFPNAAGQSEKNEKESLKHLYRSQGYGTQETLIQAVHTREHANRVAAAISGYSMPELQQGQISKGEIHLHLYLDGKEIAANTGKHVRDSSTLQKPFSEGITRYAQVRKARE